MHRRRFLALLGLAGAAAAIDPERLLWEPGKKTYFLPPIVQPLAFHPDAFAMALGDGFTLECVYAINPVTGREAEFLQRYIVTAVAPHRMDVLYGRAIMPPFAHQPLAW